MARRRRRRSAPGRVMALREALWEHREELARLVTEDMGKTLDDARGEVARGIESTEAAIAIPHLLKGENLEGVARGVDVELVRQPVGVVAAITPFNFPAMIPLWFLPFAIACGNAFILKPSERDPRPSELIFELIDGDRGDPRRALQPRPRRARRRQRAARPPRDRRDLVRRPGLDRPLRRGALGGHRQALQALGGAKNSLVVMPDADLELTVAGDHGLGLRRRAASAALPGSVAVLVGDAGASRTRSATRSPTPQPSSRRAGRPRTASTSARWSAPDARDRIADAVERAAAEGAEVVLDGRRDAGPAGTMLGPTIVDGAPTANRSSPARSSSGRSWRSCAPTTSTTRSSSPTARATATPARSSPPRATRPARYR